MSLVAFISSDLTQLISRFTEESQHHFDTKISINLLFFKMIINFFTNILQCYGQHNEEKLSYYNWYSILKSKVM